MLIDPETHGKLRDILDRVYHDVQFLIPKLSMRVGGVKEYKWAVSLAYLLLKTLGQNPLSEFLKREAPFFENYPIVKTHELQSSISGGSDPFQSPFSEWHDSFFESNLVNPRVLRKNLFTMRTDVEMKILFRLFGGKFLPQEQEILDGTGALYFPKKKFKAKRDQKLENLREYLASSKEEWIPRIALNLGSHWVALTEVKGKKIYFHDPMSGRSRRIKVKRRNASFFRFYLFRFNPEKAFVLKDEMKRFIQQETDKELKNVQSFTKGLLKSITDLEVAVKSELVQEDIKDLETENEKTIGPEKTPEEKDLRSGENLMDRIRKRIKDAFSDYSEL